MFQPLKSRLVIFYCIVRLPTGLRFDDANLWAEECYRHLLKGKPANGVDPSQKICFTYTIGDMFGSRLDVPTWGPWGKTTLEMILHVIRELYEAVTACLVS